MTETKKKHPYSIRKVRSGYGGGTTWIVVKNPGGHRVSVHAHGSEKSAWLSANSLNISAMVKAWPEDDRPYEVRRAEAEAAFLSAGNVKHDRPVA